MNDQKKNKTKIKKRSQRNNAAAKFLRSKKRADKAKRRASKTKRRKLVRDAESHPLDTALDIAADFDRIG